MSVTIDGQTIEIKQEVEEEPEIKDEPDYPTDDDDVQRAIESLKEIKDEQLQEFLDDDLLENFDVIDAWKGNETTKVDRQNETPNREKEYRRSRERHRRDREKPKRDDKKREETRRDPLKSTKDIERDKMRAKRDSEIKLLAEKEKAIKHLLDSDNVVPPGTEEEAIESIAEKQNQERAQIRNRRSRERRRSVERVRKSPSRLRSSNRFRGSPVRRRSPIILSPERRKSPYRRSPRYFDRSSLLSPERRRSPLRSWERRPSTDRRWSPDRHRRRIDIHERRRSRSRERQRSRSRTRSRTRSRSPDRLRRRLSRSPLERRYSPRRRTRSRSRSVDRRARKRSPFLNELARQLTKDAMMSSSSSHISGGGFLPTMEASSSSMTNPPMYQDPQQRGGGLPPYMHPPVPHAPMPAPGMPLPPPTAPPPSFMPYEPQPPPPPMNFEPMPMHSALPPADYASGPVMYNQANQPGPPPGQLPPPHRPPLLPPPPTPVPPPQPVPPPTPMDHAPISTYPPHTSPHQLSTRQHLEPLNKYVEPSSSYSSSRSKSPYSYRAEREERLKTPEPPVISSTKNFEKTSLSSLLEASVSAKDSSSSSALYSGFRPEIYRRCEQALRELQTEDPRLEMTGRFFFDSTKEETKMDTDDHRSNSVLLYKNKAYWGENEPHQPQSQTQHQQQRQQSPHSLMPTTHQKLCQTELRIQESKCIQVSVMTADFSMQVCPSDLEEASKEEKRPIMDRLDWNRRESYDYPSKHHCETEDLRWSLSNSSRKSSWARGGSSPLRRSHDEEYYVNRASPSPRGSRSREREREHSRERHRDRDSYSGHRGSPRDRYSRDSYSPIYSRPIDEPDSYHEGRSDYSRGESPLELDKSDEEEIEPREHSFHRGAEWIGRGKPSRGRSGSLIKNYTIRGKYSGRPFRGRGGYRGKY